MNDNIFLSINKIDRLNNSLYYQAWGRMCVAMDRLDDTMQYINSLTLCKKRSDIAFDFYEFINNMYIVIESIKTIANMFSVDFTSIESENSSFTNSCLDSKWFTFVRSLCSVHPTYTTKSIPNEIYQNYEHKIILGCPRVVWNNVNRLSNGDLAAIVYNIPTNDSGEKLVTEFTCERMPLFVKQFQSYLQKWLDFIPNIISAIHRYNNAKYDEFRQRPIKELSECKNDIERISILKNEFNRRFGNELDEIFDFYISVFCYYLSDKTNRLLLNKYKRAIRLSLDFLHNALQNMSFCGYENTGLKANNNSFLFYELYHSDIYGINDLSEYGYHLSKLYLLNSNSYFDREQIHNLLEELKPIANNYIVFTNSEREDEILILMHMVIYFASLKSDCLLNKNIPNELHYRKKILIKKDIEKLSKGKD